MTLWGAAGSVDGDEEAASAGGGSGGSEDEVCSRVTDVELRRTKTGLGAVVTEGMGSDARSMWSTFDEGACANA